MNNLLHSGLVSAYPIKSTPRSPFKATRSLAEERIWAGRTPRRQPRVPDAPRSGMLKHIKINAHKSDRVNMIILKHKIAKELENNVQTWYNFGTNKPVLVRQRYAVVL